MRSRFKNHHLRLNLAVMKLIPILINTNYVYKLLSFHRAVPKNNTACSSKVKTFDPVRKFCRLAPNQKLLSLASASETVQSLMHPGRFDATGCLMCNILPL